MRLSRLLHPWLLILLPVVISLAVWAVPGSGLFLRGFSVRSHLGMGAVLLLGGFYVMLAMLVSLGAAVGRSIPHPRVLTLVDGDPAFERSLYRVLTVIATVGVVGAYAKVGARTSIVDALAASQVNDLSTALADGSSIATLRYVAIVSSALGYYLVLKRRVRLPGVLFNTVLLAADALLTSRLALVMSIVVAVILWVNQDRSRKLPRGVLLGLLAALFAALTFFNYTRNANYYRVLGVENPLVMNAYQMAAYLGAPTQVSVGVADAVVNQGFSPVTPLNGFVGVLVPSFLQPVRADKSLALDPGLYGYHVDIAPNLNANSAFADNYAHFGWPGLLAALIAITAGGVVWGFFIRFRSALAVYAGVVGYCFLEIWRALLFAQGIIVFIGLSLTFAVVVSLALTRRESLYNAAAQPIPRRRERA